MSSTVPALRFHEDIRLVIWDLDQTFWGGTLTEGDVHWIDEHEKVLKELAARGIVSSICSKNYFEQAMELIKSKNLDSFFVFPSIDWSPKGGRLKKIIENIQLRPESILFVDDNHLNRAEALAIVPGINVVSELFVPEMLSHPQLKGKDDHDLSRLAQYKAMELRKSAQLNAEASGADNSDDFIRNSGIKVFIDYDLEGNIERCIELINRTNQLNFTKQRLSNDHEQAKREFLALIANSRINTQHNKYEDIQAGLIRCRDKYGDHGAVGLFVLSEGTVLKQFVFSCRILGMGIEQWLYKRLGKPNLKIEGEVISDPTVDDRNVDWIELVDDYAAYSASEPQSTNAKKISNFYIVGGCTMESIGHYLKIFAENVIVESGVRRDGFDIRRTHSSFLVYGDLVDNQQFVDTVAHMGCAKEDFQNRIFQADERSAVILNFWFDQVCCMYRHKYKTFEMPVLTAENTWSLKSVPLDLPFWFNDISWETDLTQLNFADLPEDFRINAKNAAKIFQYFKDNFEFQGMIDAEVYKKRVSTILAKLNPSVPVFILDVPGKFVGARQIQADMIEATKKAHEQLAASRKNTYIVDPMKLVTSDSDRMDWWHFDRKVFYRIFKQIMSLSAQ